MKLVGNYIYVKMILKFQILIKGGKNYVNYMRNTDYSFHTHPSADYKYSMPSPYDIICLTLADVYISKRNKIGFVISSIGIFSIEILQINHNNRIFG